MLEKVTCCVRAIPARGTYLGKRRHKVKRPNDDDVTHETESFAIQLYGDIHFAQRAALLKNFIFLKTNY